ncbi:alpha/beta fold hydrolase [Mesobacillus maritimus]|uniref:alpha/beta fold hydrolase n=1 Tax=Mesobacillus maritimus TaxID=1643336 RepID=UPI00384D06CD
MTRSKLSKAGIPFLHFGNGEPLVLIHGLGEVKEGWINQFELQDEFELIIPDLRGHGENETTEEISIQNFASDIIELLKECQIESANILGLSMGGAVAQEIYRQAPEMCRSLILASTFHFFPKKLAPLFINYRKKKFRNLTSGGKKKPAAALALYSWEDEHLEEFDNHFAPNHKAFFDSLHSCLKVNNLALLRKISVPTLVIGGQYDSVIPVWIQVWMHKLMPHSEFVIMRKTGHVAKLEAKERFNQLVRNFLARHRQRNNSDERISI